MKITAIISLAAILVGCGGSTVPIKDVTGAYYIDTNSPWATNARSEGIEVATKYCEKLNKEVVLVSSSGRQVIAQTRFFCQ